MLYVDPRVGSKELAPLLRARGAHVELKKGDADFYWLGDEGKVRVGVERKTIGDLLSCIADGRFAGHQLIKLHESFDVVWLLVEGEYIADPYGELLVTDRTGTFKPVPWGKRAWMHKAVEKYLSTMTHRGGVLVKNTQDRPDSADWIRAEYGWWQEPIEEHKSHRAFHNHNLMDKVNLVKPSLVRRWANELPGIGWERSLGVDKHFKAPAEMVLADAKEWASIDGIGKKTAEAVVEVIRG